MAQKTQLTTQGIPGQIRSFLAKTSAAPGPHTGLFTALAITGMPGMRHSFSAKTAVGVAAGATYIINIRRRRRTF